MGKFACLYCKYVFVMKTKEKAPLVCPNCGKEGHVNAVPDAETIIQESRFA